MSYKLGGVIWNDDGTLATKKPSPLEAFEKIIDMAHETNGYQNFTNACDAPYTKIVKNALKEIKKYKDIEEELGIDLITLFKALKNGIWVKNTYTNELEFRYFTHLSFDDLIVPDTPYMDGVEFKDYGKKWALNREDLENKKDE